MTLAFPCKPTDEGAEFYHLDHGYTKCIYEDGNYFTVKMQGPAPTFIVRQYEGACLETRERNGYHDSDFYIVVWDSAEQKPKSIQYASTAYGGGAVLATVDATPEVLEAYAAYKARRIEEARQRAAQEREDALKPVAEYAGVSVARAERLMNAVGESAFHDVAALLSDKLRSNFRKSLRDQVVAWLQADSPKYSAPLSRKQMGCLTRRYGR